MTDTIDAARLRRRETLTTTAWVVLCGCAGWALAALTLRLNPLLAIAAFGASGAAAGIRLNAGWQGMVGFAATFAIGNLVAFLPVMATQAMTGDETFSQVGSFSVLTLATGYGIAATLGFIPILRWGVKSYATIVIGFGAGGALGGFLLGVSISAGLWPLGVVALAVPLATGGFAATQAAPRGSTSDSPAAEGVRPAWLEGRRALVYLAVTGILLTVGAFVMLEWRKADGRREMGAQRNAQVVSESAALYKALARLKDMPATTAGGPADEREALEIYVAVRYRSRLKDTTWNSPELRAIAEDVARRHADKTDEDLSKAALKLGVDYLDELNGPRLTPRAR